MEIRYAGTLRPDEWGRVLALHHRQTPAGLAWRGAVLVLIVIGAAVSPRLGDGQRFVLFLLGVAAILVTRPFWIRFAARLGYRQSRDAFQPITGIASEDGLSVASGNVRTEIGWAQFTSRRSGEDLTLLYQSPRCFNYFPRRFFESDADWSDFNELTERQVGQLG
jgi:hypothetical protein